MKYFYLCTVILIIAWLVPPGLAMDESYFSNDMISNQWWFASSANHGSQYKTSSNEEIGNEQKDMSIYSYITLGGEYTDYSEKEGYYGATSNATTNGIAFLSGGLGFRVADKFGLSIQGASTLFPGEGTETWTLDGEMVLENHFSISTSKTTLLGHYFFGERSRLITGPTFILRNFTRSMFSGKAVDEITCNGDPDCIEDELLRVEYERDFTLSWLLGYGYYMIPGEKGDFRMGASVFGGLPIYKNISNTRYPETEFTSTDGYLFMGIFSLGYMIYPGLDIGLYLDYQFTKFYNDTEQAYDIVTDSMVTAEIPENTTQVFHYGLALSYSF